MAIAVLAAGVVLIFMLYVSSRTDDLTERDFRVLGDKSAHVCEALENLHGALINASKKLTNAATSSGPAANIVDETTNFVEYSTDAVQAFTNVVGEIEPPVSLLPLLPSTELKKSGGPFSVTNIDFAQGGNGYWLLLTYSNKRSNACFTAKVDLGDLLGPILNEDDFADILLAKTNGEVVFQLSQSEDRSTDPSASADVRINHLPGLGSVAETNTTARGTCLRNVKVADTAYKVFAQPLKVSLEAGQHATVDGWLCGLARAKDFRVASWAIPTTTAVAFIFIAVGLLGLWPFLNILWAGPAAGISRVEAAWVLGGSFFGCAALTFLLLYSTAFLGSEQISDRDLEALAMKVRTNVIREISEIDQFLTSLDRQLLQEASRARHATDSDAWLELQERTNAFNELTNLTNLCPSLVEAFWVDRRGDQVAKKTPRRTATAFVSVADRAYFRNIVRPRAWARRGTLVNQVAAGTNSVSSNNVFYVQSIFSKTRGENLAVFSHPFPYGTNDWPAGDRRTNKAYVACPAVSAMTFRPLSLFSPVLPAGYGFCIIEPNGRVLFHSDRSRNLRENFIVEAGQDRQLQSAVYARTAETFDVRYLNAIYNLEVMPLAGFPWTIITFRDEGLLGSVHRNILLTAVVLFGAYLVALVLGLLIRTGLVALFKPAGLVRTCGWWALRWPKNPPTPTYFIRALFAAVLSVLGALALGPCRSPDRLLLWVLGAAVVVLPLSWVLECLTLQLGGEGAEANRGLSKTDGGFLHPLLSSPATYWAYLGLVLVLFAMLPAFACYKIAFLKEMELYVKGTQLQVARDLQERPTRTYRRVRKWTSRGGGSDYWRFVRAARRTNYHGLNRYLDFFEAMSATPNVESVSLEETSATNRWPGETEWFNRLYSAIRPRFAETQLQTGSLLFPQAADRSWWSYCESNRLALVSEGLEDRDGVASIKVSSQVPKLNWLTGAITADDSPWRYSWYLGVLATLFAPFLFSRFIARNLLLLNLPPELRRKRVIRHMHINALLSEPGKKSSKPPAFESIERTFIQVSDSSKIARDEERLERGAVIVLPVPDEAVIDICVDVLEQPNHRTHTAVFVGNCGCSSQLWSVRQGNNAVLQNDPDQCVTSVAVASRLGAEFRETWDDCTGWEKLTLYQVAKTGFANARRPELRSLLQRELLRFDPELCLRNESFRRFVLATFQTEEVMRELQADAAGGPLTWRSIRGPLAIVISAGALFLFATQQELWQLAVGLAGSFAAAIQGLSRISSLFQKSKGDASGSSQG